MKRKAIIILFLSLIVASCGNEPSPGDVITEIGLPDGNVSTICDPRDFDNEDAFRQHNKGLNLVREGKFKLARMYFNKALKKDPENHVILNSIGLTEMKLLNYDIASGYFKRALQLDSSYFMGYSNYGLNLYYAKDYEGAMEVLRIPDYNKADSISRRAGYFHLFMCFTKVGKCDSALAYYQLAKSAGRTKIFQTNIEKFRLKEFIYDCNDWYSDKDFQGLEDY